MPAAVVRRGHLARLAFALLLAGAGAVAQVGGPSVTGGLLNPTGGTDATPDAIVLPRRDHDAAAVIVDGRLDEAVWRQIPAYDHMIVTTPDVKRRAAYRTHTFLFYTERGLYVGAWNEQPVDTLMGPLSGRDTFDYADAFQIVIDSSGSGLYGYWFRVKLGDSLMDGTLLPERQFERNWDGPWDARTERRPDGWSVEMFLPWAMMNMPGGDGDRRIAIEIARFLPHLNEVWSWPALPDTQPQFISLFQPVTLAGVAPRQEVSVFPYAAVSGDLARDSRAEKAGVDVFWRPSPALFLSAAVNPDFGQVEADNVVVNLSAYETFFPEKRLFFQENQEVFSTGSYGYGNDTTLLHTRRMGSSVGSRRGRPDFDEGERHLGQDLRKPVDLLLAAKGVGQTGRARYGGIVVTEDDTRVGRADGEGTSTAPGRDFGVLRYQYEDTATGGRRAVGWLGTAAEHSNRRAVTQAVDAHYRTPAGAWSVDAQAISSDVAGRRGWGGLLNVINVPRSGWQHFFHVASYDDRLDLNDLGYLRRNDHTLAFYEFWHRRQDYERIRDTTSWLYVEGDANGSGQLIGAEVNLHYGWGFLNNSRLDVDVDYELPYWDDRNSRGNGTFRVGESWETRVFVNSPPDGTLTANASFAVESEPLGGREASASSFVSYSPLDRVRVRLGVTYNNRDAWLVWQGGASMTTFRSENWFGSLGVETYFSARQHLRIELQWAAVKAYENTRYRIVGETWLERLDRPAEADPASFAISDVVLQARYRWQIAPMSDLFIVYNRTGSLPDGGRPGRFPSLFNDSFGAPEEEGLLLKIRYRFGT